MLSGSMNVCKIVVAILLLSMHYIEVNVKSSPLDHLFTYLILFF